ncbi:MAG: hypothetical protein JSR42_11710 [Proteobacteria bacterium]|nr:hypothetical protein [Pseudomonadota bacterium]
MTHAFTSRKLRPPDYRIGAADKACNAAGLSADGGRDMTHVRPVAAFEAA